MVSEESRMNDMYLSKKRSTQLGPTYSRHVAEADHMTSEAVKRGHLIGVVVGFVHQDAFLLERSRGILIPQGAGIPFG